MRCVKLMVAEIHIVSTQKNAYEIAAISNSHIETGTNEAAGNLKQNAHGAPGIKVNDVQTSASIEAAQIAQELALETQSSKKLLPNPEGPSEHVPWYEVPRSVKV